MPISKKRQKEIMRLVYEGGDELTQAMALGPAAEKKHLRSIRREVKAFLETCNKPAELHFFAEEWNRDGNETPIHILIKNPYVDAGTLLRIYWMSSPEDYYLFNASASELDPGFDRDVFLTLRRIERRMLKGDFKSSVIPFDPTPRISMPERHHEFARQIPKLMFQPITGRKPKRG